MANWKQLLLLGLVGYVFAIQVVPADEYNASLWAMNIAATNGRPLHPYNVFSFHANESQSAGQLHYSSTNSRLMKRDTFYYDHSTARYIFQLSFYTSDNTDLFEAAIPLGGTGTLAFERATDLWLYVGYSSNNMSASNPVDFVMGPDGYAQVDKIVIDSMVYNERYENFQAINSHISTYPHLGAIYYMRNVYGQGINNITIRFFIKPNTEASNPPLPTGNGVTSAGVLESICDTLDNNCNLCSSHPRCVWCSWNVSGEIGGTCMMNTAQFTVPRCLDVGGELFNSQCQRQTPYTVPYTSTPHSTIIDDTRPITVTTGRPVTSGKPRPEILVESDEEPKLNSGQIFAIAFSIVGAVLVVALGVGSYLLYKKGRNPPKVDAVELSTKKEQI